MGTDVSTWTLASNASRIYYIQYVKVEAKKPDPLRWALKRDGQSQ